MGGNPTPVVRSTPPPSHIQTQPPFIAFKPDSVPPSQFIYLQLNDWLTINCLSNLSNCPMLVKYRYLTPQSEIKEGTLNFTIPGTFGAASFQLGEGWLLSIAVQNLQPAIQGTFVHAQIVITRANVAIANQITYAVIWQGYTMTSSATGWPGGPSKDPTDGMGALRSVTGSAPAAGADINEVVPGNRRWTLLAFKASLATSAVAGARNAGFAVDDGANVFFQIKSSLAQNASLTLNYMLVPGQQFLNDTQNNIILPGPNPTQLKTGFRIRTSTQSILAGDQWSAPQYLIQEWGSWDF